MRLLKWFVEQEADTGEREREEQRNFVVLGVQTLLFPYSAE